MGLLRLVASRLWRAGRVSPATYRVLTGLAMLLVADALWTARDHDGAAGPVAWGFLVGAIVMIGRGAQGLRRRSAGREPG